MLTPEQIITDIEAIPTREDKERDYIGASSIGHECSRFLWLQFHRYIWPEKFSPRMLRLFQRGKDEEFKFEVMLKCIGFEVIQDCQDQKGFAVGFFKGHGDGIVQKDGIKYAAEYKTHNKKSFDTLAVGALSSSHPKHYAQGITYADKFGCDAVLYLAVCKDDDRLFCDVIPANHAQAETYQAKADFIATSDKPPERIASKPTDFRCKFCSAHAVCWGMEMPRVDCRNCTSVNKDQVAGVFGCDLEKPWVGGKLVACEKHSFNPYALNNIFGWDMIEFYPSTRSVKYGLSNGKTFINGQAGIPSNELTVSGTRQTDS